MERQSGMVCPNCRKECCPNPSCITVWIMAINEESSYYKAEFPCAGCNREVMADVPGSIALHLVDHGAQRIVAALDRADDSLGVDGILDALNALTRFQDDPGADFLGVELARLLDEA